MSATSQWPLPSDGIRFLSPAFMLSKLARHPLTRECYPAGMGYYPNATNHRMQRTRHDDNLLIYCVDGGGHVTTPQWLGRVSAGEVLVLPQGVPHQYHADLKQPWSIYWVHYQGVSSAIFNQYLGYREGEKLTSYVGISPQLKAHFHSLLEVQRTGYNTRAFINASNHLRYLLTQIALEARRATAISEHNFDLEEIQRFMLENLAQQLDLDTLAATTKLSKFHFSTKYKALTGYSPIKHFLNMKMEHACQLLDSEDLSVKGVAAALGYEDPLYFSRMFKKTVGMSPRAYRSSVRK